MDHAPAALAPDHPGLPALHRLAAIAATDTGQASCVADFLLAWWNAQACGGFDPTILWGVAAPIRDDMLAVLDLIARHREFPGAYGLDEAFAALVRRWRPHVQQAHR